MSIPRPDGHPTGRTDPPAGVTGSVLIVSSVRVAVLTTLADALARLEDVTVRVVSAFEDERWRTARAAGRLGRAVARLAGLLFPLTVRLGPAAGPRVVVATTNPFWLPTLLALRRVRPLVTLVYDVYPDALEVRWRIPGWLRGILRRAVGHGLRRSDVVVVLGDRVRAALAERYGLGERIAVIPTGADPAAFRDTAADDVAIEAPPGTVLVSYVGNSGSMHEGRTLGLALADVLARRTDVRAVIATRGDRAHELHDALRDSPRVRLAAGLDEGPFRATLARTDVALVTLAAGAGLASVPSKVYAALAAGCAVLAVAPDDSDLADLVRASGAGLVVPPGDVGAATAALERLVTDEALRSGCAAAARTAAEDLTPTALARRWAPLLRPLLG